MSRQIYVCVLMECLARIRFVARRRGCRSMRYIVRYVVYFGVFIRRSGCAACSSHGLPSPVIYVSNTVRDVTGLIGRYIPS